MATSRRGTKERVIDRLKAGRPANVDAKQILDSIAART